MKKILFFLIVGLVSCKSDYITLDNDDSVEIDDSNKMDETAPAVIVESEGLSERAMQITSASAANRTANEGCERYKQYAKLKVGTGTDGSEFTLRGKEFGLTQAATVAEVEIPSGTTPIPVSVVSWSDTTVKVKIPRVATTTKNITIKIRLKKDLRTTTASFSSVGWFSDENIHFGHNRWDIMQDTTLRILYPNLSANKVAISTNWTPAYNEILYESADGICGVITSTKIIATGLNKGKYEVKVSIRNGGTCRGTVSVKKYLLHIGTLQILTAATNYPTAFTHYLN